MDFVVKTKKKQLDSFGIIFGKNWIGHSTIVGFGFPF